MKVIVDLCIVPIGVGVKLAPYQYAACEPRADAATPQASKIQLPPQRQPQSRGNGARCSMAIEACHQVVHPGLLAGFYNQPWRSTPPPRFIFNR